MKGGTYTKTFAKIQVRGIFRIRDIQRNVLPKPETHKGLNNPLWVSAQTYRDLYGDAPGVVLDISLGGEVRLGPSYPDPV